MRERRRADTNSVTYSQNHIRSQDLVKNLLDSSSITQDDVVIEIGPGTGLITEELVRRCNKVVAVEIDSVLCKKLREKFANLPNIKVHCESFLRIRLPKYPYKVFSNIPFNVTSDIIRKLVDDKSPPQEAYLFVQKQAALRFIGPAESNETQISLLIKPRFELNIIHEFRRTDFCPVPNVDVVLLHIKKRERPLVPAAHTQEYRDFIVYAFNQWKPTLFESLGQVFTRKQLLRLAKSLHIDPLATPAEVNFPQWLGLFAFFVSNVEDKKKSSITGWENRLLKQQARLHKNHRTRLSEDMLASE